MAKPSKTRTAYVAPSKDMMLISSLLGKGTSSLVANLLGTKKETNHPASPSGERRKMTGAVIGIFSSLLFSPVEGREGGREGKTGETGADDLR